MFRADERDKRFYGGDNAIPYSNIRPEDYYRSTLDRLEDVFEHVSKEDYALKVLMCSPGISMIGDDCRRVVRDDDGFMLLDTDRLSDEGCKGFDECLHDILEYLDPAPGDKIERGAFRDALEEIKSRKFSKSYNHSFWGYSNLLTGAVNLSTEKVVTNRAGADLDKYFRKLFTALKKK